jgi:hypothetical protein
MPTSSVEYREAHDPILTDFVVTVDQEELEALGKPRMATLTWASSRTPSPDPAAHPGTAGDLLRRR